MLLLGVERNDIRWAWQRSIPADSPNQFMINIEPEQLRGLQAFFQAELGETACALLLIRGRISAVKGIPVAEYDFPAPQVAAFIQREASITWSGAVPDNNTIAAGEWSGEDYRAMNCCSVPPRPAGPSWPSWPTTG